MNMSELSQSITEIKKIAEGMQDRDLQMRVLDVQNSISDIEAIFNVIKGWAKENAYDDILKILEK